MSGTTAESTNIPTTTTMDTDKVEESHHSLESPVAVTANTTTNTSTTTDYNNSTNAIHVDVANPATIPLQSTGTTNTISTDMNHHHPSQATTTTTTTINTPPSRLPYKYDPDKITLRFLFANRDGLTVTVTCNPSDTIGEVKGALISIWPKGKNFFLICCLLVVETTVFLTSSHSYTFLRCSFCVKKKKMYRIVRMGMIYA